ncbi:MAG: hypothetical protein SGCHY_001450 [Lobulomycetales sp.]
MSNAEKETTRAVIAYLQKSFPESADCLARESGLKPAALDTLAARWLATAPAEKKPSTGSKLDVLHILSLHHNGHVNALVCNPVYMNTMASASTADIILSSDFSSPSVSTLKGHTRQVTALAFDSKGVVLASASIDSTIKLWNTNDSVSACYKTLYGHDHSVSDLAFLSDDVSLVSCSRDNTLKFWDLDSGFCSRTSNVYQEPQVTVSSATGGADRKIILWDAQGDLVEEMENAHEHVIESLLFARIQDRQVLLSGARDCKITIRDVANLAPLHVLTVEGWVRDLSFFNGLLQSVGDDGNIRTWDLEAVPEPRCIATIKAAHDGSFVTCASCWTGHFFVTAGLDSKIRVWE